jgi:hypothetical protein
VMYGDHKMRLCKALHAILSNTKPYLQRGVHICIICHPAATASLAAGRLCCVNCKPWPLSPLSML